jgi:hypothetical protein
VLACGVLMARHWSAISSGARLQARQLWDWLVFVLEGLSFVLVGVQLRTVVEGIEGRSLADLALAALALNLVVIVVRLALVYPASWLPRLSARVRERDPFPGWPAVTVIGWAGMRGVVTLALALAIPTTVEGGGPFPDRNLVVFLAFSVIVVTLVGEGITGYAASSGETYYAPDALHDERGLQIEGTDEIGLAVTATTRTTPWTLLLTGVSAHSDEGSRAHPKKPASVITRPSATAGTPKISP